MVFYAAFNSISVISRRQLTLFMSFLGFISTRLGSEVSCPRSLPRKNPEGLLRLEHRTPGLQVKHFTTEPRRTPLILKCYFQKILYNSNGINSNLKELCSCKRGLYAAISECYFHKIFHTFNVIN